MRLLLILALATLPVLLLQAQDDYQPGPDSIAQANVPKGELIKGTYTAKEGSVFPGTEREYTIYLPATYNLTKASIWPFMVFQDGVIYNAPVVFDNLIAKGQIPPLIGIFIKPGVVPAANPNALPRYNRSYEYDSVSDTYSRFLIAEFLPAIEAKHGIKLSTDPNAAAISGNSSGGICAFMTAWHRPDRFRRVFSGVGTYVGIHGADQLPVLVRKFEPKPLRIYLQSGEHDNDLYCGDWWMANQTMERALKWAGYDVAHTWGTGGHNAKHGTAIFPDVLRWLWRDYATAKEIKANPRGESKWLGYGVLNKGTAWDLCWQRPLDKAGSIYLSEASYLASNKDGNVFSSLALSDRFNPNRDRRIKHGDHTDWRLTGRVASYGPLPGGLVQIPLGKPGILIRELKGEDALYGLCMGDGDTLLCSAKGKDEPSLAAISENKEIVGAWEWKPLSKDAPFLASSLCLSRLGRLYATYRGPEEIDTIHTFSYPELTSIDDLLSPIYIPGVSRIALSPDQKLLYASSSQSRFIYSCHITEKGTLTKCQPYYHLEADDDGIVDARGLCVDTNGWLYVATALGIQVCDQAGRVNFIIPTPQQPYDVCFGGKDLGELFIACGDKIYKRPTKAHGIVSGQMAPIKPAPPKL